MQCAHSLRKRHTCCLQRAQSQAACTCHAAEHRDIGHAALRHRPPQVPVQFKLGPVTALSAGLGMLPRVGKGAAYRKARMPKEPLTIWGYEASPFVKLAREVGPCRQGLSRPAAWATSL